MEKYLEQFARTPTPTKVGALVGLVAVLTGLNYYFFVSDLDTRIQHQVTQRASLEQELADKTALANNLNKYLKEMEQLETQLAEALTEMPEDKQIDALLAQLNDIGRKAGLVIDSVVPDAEQRDPAITDMVARIPIKMVVTGNYHEIALFMQELGNLRRIVNVSEIQLGAPALRNEKVVLQSAFVATAFRFVSKPPAK